MPLYKSANQQTVSHKRFAINQDPGVYLAEPHAELDELVAQGLLVVEGVEPVKPAEPAAPAAPTTKNASPAAATA